MRWCPCHSHLWSNLLSLHHFVLMSVSYWFSPMPFLLRPDLAPWYCRDSAPIRCECHFRVWRGAVWCPTTDSSGCCPVYGPALRQWRILPFCFRHHIPVKVELYQTLCCLFPWISSSFWRYVYITAKLAVSKFFPGKNFYVSISQWL